MARQLTIRLRHKTQDYYQQDGIYKSNIKEYMLSPPQVVDRPSKGTTTVNLTCAHCGSVCKVGILSSGAVAKIGLIGLVVGVVLLMLFHWIPDRGRILGLLLFVTGFGGGFAVLGGLLYLAASVLTVPKDFFVEGPSKPHDVEIL